MDVMTSVFRHGALRRLLVWGLLASLSAAAQEISNSPAAPFLIRTWQGEQGLPNNTVNAITQTRDGYLWLGTDEGLARFDGVHCRVFGLRDGLKNLQISALLEDRQGGLWIGTSGGGIGRMVRGQIRTYTVKDGLAGNSISSFVEATNGDVWIGTHTGLSRWRDGTFEPLAKELGPILVFDLAKDRRGDIWAATLHNGLLCFHDGQFVVAMAPVSSLTNNPRCVLVDSHDRVWVGLREKKILCRENSIWTHYGTNEGFPEVVTYHLAETASGAIWAGSWNEGLYCFQNGRFNALQKKDGLSDAAVLSLFSGREQFLWVGTQSGGLNRIGPKKLSVDHLMQASSECQLRSLVQTTNGELWVGTYGQGLYRWRGAQAGQLLEDPFRRHLLVEAVLAGRDGSLWWGAGPSLYQWKNGRLISFFSDPPWLFGDRVWSLCEDRDAGIWVGTYNGQFGLLKQGSFTPVQGFAGKPVTALTQAPDGTLWVGSLGGGLARLQNGILTVFSTKEGLQSDLIRALLLDADGALWIGTDGGGLNRWSHGRMAGFTMQQGLPDDVILQILEDDDGCLWLGCNHGISRVLKRTLDEVADGKSTAVHPLNFGILDGMASEQCVGNFGAALKTKTGQLCFATAKGIVVIDPHQNKIVPFSPTVLLEAVLVDKQEVKNTASAGSDLAGDSSPDSTVSIPPGRHSFEFHYTGIGFDAPEKIQFRYWLEGLDTGWTEAGAARVARYSSLPPGPYRFRVQAGNLNGRWNNSEVGLAFVVRAYFWQTPWFMVLAALVLVGMLAAGIRLVERRRYRARLNRMQQEQAMERERMRIARDLHDELGSSLTQISMLCDLGPSAASGGERLKKLEKRVQTISTVSIHTVRSLDEIVWAVNPRNDSLRSLVLYLTEFARELLEDTDIDCRFLIAEDLPQASLPPDLRHNIFLAVKEALHNALKHSRATKVTLGAKAVGRQVEISLQDNGAGFDLATVRAGNGLANMRQRIEALGGRFVVETNPGQGTTVRLTVNCPPTPAKDQ